MPITKQPVYAALVNDYDVVVIGIAHMLEPYRDRVVIAELDAGRAVEDDVDVVLYDTFAQPESDEAEIEVLVKNPHAGHVAVYTWNFHAAPGQGGSKAGCQRLPVQGVACSRSRGRDRGSARR